MGYCLGFNSCGFVIRVLLAGVGVLGKGVIILEPRMAAQALQFISGPLKENHIKNNLKR